jgi:glutaryl-CoA dehydrogenase
MAPGVDPVDILDVDHELTDEERAIRDAVRAFVRTEILPGIGDWFEAGEFPREVGKGLADLGLLGMHLTGYECAGANAVSYGLACLELEAGDSGFRSFVSVQGSLCMFPIWRFGSEEQKQAYLPSMARGELIGCFGLTEPDFGSDPGNMRTSARRDGSDWVLSGTKMWITNGGIADLAIVWGQTDEGIRGFIVPTDSPGFSTKDIHRKLSLRASVTSELVLDEVRLPADAVLPDAVGLKGPLACLSEARFGIVWGALGAANMALELNLGTLLALHLGRMKDEGRVRPEHISFGKLNNVRESLKIAREARTILGASGITLEYPVIRHMNNLESVLTYEGTSEIHTLILGQAITGERAFE